MPVANRKRVVVTTSWDDGCRTDLKIAEILEDRCLAGTFYVPITPYNGLAPLTNADLRSLSQSGFEIGAHGFSHKLLWGLSREELGKEIDPCRPILEDILGTQVKMFCYPRGRYDSKAVQAIKAAGYLGARTVGMLATHTEFNRYEMPTTLQAAPNSRFSYLKNILRARAVTRAHVCVTQWKNLGDWVALGKTLFESILDRGGVWHLYGHSWEIDEWNLWDSLKQILDYVARREEVTYIPNWKAIPARAGLAVLSENENNTSS